MEDYHLASTHLSKPAIFVPFRRPPGDFSFRTTSGHDRRLSKSPDSDGQKDPTSEAQLEEAS